MGDEKQVREAPDSEHEDEATADPGSEEAESSLAADCVTREEIDEEHLSELPDGSGCVEVWEHLANQRGDDG